MCKEREGTHSNSVPFRKRWPSFCIADEDFQNLTQFTNVNVSAVESGKSLNRLQR